MILLILLNNKIKNRNKEKNCIKKIHQNKKKIIKKTINNN